MIRTSLLCLALGAPAYAQDPETGEYYPGENEIIQQLEQEAAQEEAAEPEQQQEDTIPVSPLETETSIESLREQGESFFDTPGSLAIEPSAFQSIEDGAFPVPEVSPPTPVEEPAPSE